MIDWKFSNSFVLTFGRSWPIFNYRNHHYLRSKRAWVRMACLMRRTVGCCIKSNGKQCRSFPFFLDYHLSISFDSASVFDKDGTPEPPGTCLPSLEPIRDNLFFRNSDIQIITALLDTEAPSNSDSENYNDPNSFINVSSGGRWAKFTYCTGSFPQDDGTICGDSWVSWQFYPRT